MVVILQTYKSFLKFFGSHHLGRKELLWRIVSIFHLVTLITYILAPINLEPDLKQFMNSVLSAAGGSLVYAIATHILINGVKFNSLVNELQDIVDERIRLKGNAVMYAKIEHKMTFYTNIARKNIYLLIVFALFPFARVAYDCCLGKYSVDSWIFFVRFWWPFEVNTTFQCTIMVFIQLFLFFYGSIVLCTILSFFTGIVMYIQALLADIKSLFNRIEKLLKSKEKETELAIFEYCKEAIDLHARVYGCSRQLADLMNLVIFSAVTPSVLTLCSALLLSDMVGSADSLHDMLFSLSVVSTFFNLLFVLFYFGQMLHTSLIDFSDLIYQTEWNRYPRTVQRAVLIMMMRAHQPFYISAYGIIRCTLENFVGVLKYVYSAFMMLRSFK